MDNAEYTDFLARLGRRIGSARRARGLSQEQAAHLVGLDRVHIGYLEQGRRNPSLPTLYRLALVYEVRVGEFFDFEEDPDEAFSPAKDD